MRMRSRALSSLTYIYSGTAPHSMHRPPVASGEMACYTVVQQSCFALNCEG